MNSIELFTGAGGLAMATAGAGFHHLDLVERDRYCCETINENIDLGAAVTKGWPRMEPRDVTKQHFSQHRGQVDLLAGGPPCQPFSLGGKHRAHNDDRDMFPYAVRAIRETRPKAVILENVKGLSRASYTSYLQYIMNQIRYPDMERRANEDMVKHLGRLERHHTKAKSAGEYRVLAACLNSADYGVPQRRERVFIVGIRADLQLGWSFEDVAPTNSSDRLLWDQWVTGEYWDHHPDVRRPDLPQRLRRRVDQLESTGTAPSLAPWVTTRDALKDLPHPESADAKNWSNHRAQKGARSYPGHTGSPLDEPSKTIKAGVHGVPGGENMIRHLNGKVRYLTVRETARIQCFPDDYVFHGSWTETMRQLGNAVPVKLGSAVVTSVKRSIEDQTAH